MRFLTYALAPLAVLLVAGPTSAQDRGGPPEGAGPGRPSRERIVARFDKDGDGKLNDEERAKARKAVEKWRGEQTPATEKQGKAKREPKADRPQRGARGPQARGERGRGARGPIGPGARAHMLPSPERIFARFDANKDGQLSKEEFMKLSRAMMAIHAQQAGPLRGQFGPPRGQFGPHPGAQRPGGPPARGEMRRPSERRSRPEPAARGDRDRGGHRGRPDRDKDDDQDDDHEDKDD